MNVNDRVEKRALSFLLAGILLFCFVAMASVLCVAEEIPTPDAAFPKLGIGNSVVIIGAIIAILAAFGYLIQVGVKTSEKKNLGKGELRRAIAGTFVVGFSVIAVLAFVSGILRVHIVTAYIELVGVVIGFYFGQRTVETAVETAVETMQEEEKAPKTQ